MTNFVSFESFPLNSDMKCEISLVNADLGFIKLYKMPSAHFFYVLLGVISNLLFIGNSAISAGYTLNYKYALCLCFINVLM